MSILNGFEIPIHIWIGNDKLYNFTKNMPPSWIVCVFGPFFKLLSSFLCIDAHYKLYILSPYNVLISPREGLILINQ